MVNLKKTEIKVGLVTIIALSILALGLFFARGCNVSVSQQSLKFRFPHSGGLQISNPVVVNGVKRGIVTSIKNEGGSVLVEASINNINDIFSDATAVISILEITGGKKIDINPGISGIKIDNSKEIIGKTAADISDLVMIFGNLSNDVIRVFNRVDTLTERMTYIFSSNNFADKIISIVDNTTDLMANTKELLNSNFDAINSIIRDIKSITGDFKNDYKKYEPRVDSLMNNLVITVNSANRLIGKLDSTSNALNTLLADAKAISSEIKDGKGVVSKMIYDKEFANHLDSTITNLNEFVNFIRANGVNVNVRLGTRP